MLSALVVLHARPCSKGWVDRVWGPGTAFVYDAKDGHLGPNLHNIKLFGVVTSYGSSWWIVARVRRRRRPKVLMRGMKPLCAKDAQSFYLAHYGMDASTAASRGPFWRRSGAGVARICESRAISATKRPRRRSVLPRETAMAR